MTDLSSTSWKRQLGLWLVVKILLSGGIRGAERTQMENKSEDEPITPNRRGIKRRVAFTFPPFCSGG